jgi:hypothetical protein
MVGLGVIGLLFVMVVLAGPGAFVQIGLAGVAMMNLRV